MGTLLYYMAKGDNTRVGRGDLVQSNFANVDLPLVSRLVPWGNKAFHCVGLLACMVVDVNCTINNATASNTQKFDEFKGSSINEYSNGWRDGVEGRTNLLRHVVLQQGFHSLGLSHVGF